MNALNFLKFEDWISARDTDVNWTTVAQSVKEKEGTDEKIYFIISILADKIEPKKILESEEWFSMVEFGNPEIWNDEGLLKYNSNNYIEKNGVKIQPFVIHRGWFHKSLDSKFEVIQDFLLFYNLYYDSKSNMFKTISKTGDEYDIIKLIYEKGIKKIEINTKFLKNYLAIKNKNLVRQHDHTRFTNDSIKSITGKEHELFYLKDDSYHFHLVLAENSCSSYKSFSRLLGKDIILAFEQGKALLEWGKKFCAFKISQDKEGNDVEETCNEEELSNYFVNRGKPLFLTPVYFKREALKKYYDAPSKYTVSPNSLSCDSLWSITIDTTDENLIQVWLGDLGRIPFKEQEHWKLFNVLSDGKITSSRFKRDFMAEFADPEDIMFKFHKSLSEFQKDFKQKYNFELFLQLKNEDKQVYNTLRIPVNNELPEFEEQIGNLAKLLPDSIDIVSVKKYLKENGMDDKTIEYINDRKIRALEIFIQKTKSKEDIIKILDIIQDIRSKYGISHRRGEDCNKVLEKYGFDKMHNTDIIKKIVEDIIKAFDNKINKL